MGGRGSKNQREVRSREQRGKERRRGRKRERGGTGKGKEKKGKIIRFIKDHEVFRKYTEASIRSDWRRKETFKVEKSPIPCKAATILRECCHVPVHLALGTGRQEVAAAATQAHGTPGQTSTRRAPSTRDQ